MFAKKFSLAVMAFTLVVTATAFSQEYSRNEARSAVSRERAQQIALQHVDGGRVIDSDFNNRWFRDNDYDFVVVDTTNRYDIRVDAENGQVISVDQTPIFQDNLDAGDRTRMAAATNAVQPERIRSIAMERNPNAAIVDMSRTMDGDMMVYDVEMMGNNMQVNMRVDGMTGRILSYDESRMEDARGMFNRSRLNETNFMNRDRGVNAAGAPIRDNRARTMRETRANTPNTPMHETNAYNNSLNRMDNDARNTMNRMDNSARNSMNQMGNSARNTMNRMETGARNTMNRLDNSASNAMDRMDNAANRLNNNSSTDLNRNTNTGAGSSSYPNTYNNTNPSAGNVR